VQPEAILNAEFFKFLLFWKLIYIAVPAQVCDRVHEVSLIQPGHNLMNLLPLTRALGERACGCHSSVNRIKLLGVSCTVTPFLLTQCSNF